MDLAANASGLIRLPSLDEALEHDTEWRSIQETLAKFALHDVAYWINRGCRLWLQGDPAPARAAPRSSFLHSLPPRSLVFSWAASEVVRHALLWSPPQQPDGVLLRGAVRSEQV